jgi:hypothetical protein
MGAIFQGKDAPPRAKYTMRLRRAVPALCLLLGLSLVAGFTWLRVLDRVERTSSAAAGCSTPADTSGRVQLRVYNATAREGLAKAVATQLAGRGYAILATENDPLADVRPVEGTAEVRYGPAGARYAQAVRRQVPKATLYRDAREGAVLDVVIGAAYKRLATPAELGKGRQGIAAVPAAPVPSAAPSPRC